MIKKAPIAFAPYLKTVIWGGDKICKYKNITCPEPKIGESWEISAVPGNESVVSEGEYKGLTLTRLIEDYGEELLGKKVVEKYGLNFPLLIKFIDAADNLSVQVHPDDALAKERHNSLGKTEMWYIIATDEDAKIYAGLNVKMTPDDYVKRVKEGKFAETLAVHDSRPGDVFFLPAGRVHAIGAGNLLAEIQETSDITYRIYDYDRKDANGKGRELHTEQAKDAIDYTVWPDYRTPSPSDNEARAELVSCEHFTTHRIKVDGEETVGMDGSSFCVLICIEGEVTVECSEGSYRLTQGHTVLMPASSGNFILKGNGLLLASGV